jgi:hypothetical protein
VFDAPEMLCEFSLTIVQRTKPSATNPHTEHSCSSQSGASSGLLLTNFPEGRLLKALQYLFFAIFANLQNFLDFGVRNDEAALGSHKALFLHLYGRLQRAIHTNRTLNLWV